MPRASTRHRHQRNHDCNDSLLIRTNFIFRLFPRLIFPLNFIFSLDPFRREPQPRLLQMVNLFLMSRMDKLIMWTDFIFRTDFICRQHGLDDRVGDRLVNVELRHCRLPLGRPSASWGPGNRGDATRTRSAGTEWTTAPAVAGAGGPWCTTPIERPLGSPERRRWLSRSPGRPQMRTITVRPVGSGPLAPPACRGAVLVLADVGHGAAVSLDAPVQRRNFLVYGGRLPRLLAGQDAARPAWERAHSRI